MLSSVSDRLQYTRNQNRTLEVSSTCKHNNERSLMLLDSKTFRCNYMSDHPADYMMDKTRLTDYFWNKPSNNLFILIVTLLFVFITLYLYIIIKKKQLYWLVIIYTIKQCVLYLIQDQSIAIVEHLFIYGSGRTLISQP